MADSVAAAAAAAATMEDQSSLSLADDNFNATSALVSFLRMEADVAEQKARRLRQQAAALAQQFGVSEAQQEAYELDPGQMPPLDENGVPKYKGKKRGRKPKPRKRKANPNRRKRQHTGYTLFMQETYPGIKAENPTFASKDIIAILAKRWGEASQEEKADWKARAVSTHQEEEAATAAMVDDEEAVAAAAAAAAAVEDVDEEEEDDEDDDGDDGLDDEGEASFKEDEPAPPARRSRRQKK